MNRILIVPFGEVERTTLDALVHSIRECYRCETVVAEQAAIPEKTYNSRRKQYHSTRILRNLEGIERPEEEHLLGVIDEDLYVPELNFVFGEADMMAHVAVIGLARLRQEYYGLEPDREFFLLRAAKEAIHELGHTCGLVHCHDRKCVMYFSNSLADTDEKQPLFCAVCRIELEEGEA